MIETPSPHLDPQPAQPDFRPPDVRVFDDRVGEFLAAQEINDGPQRLWALDKLTWSIVEGTPAGRLDSALDRAAVRQIEPSENQSTITEIANLTRGFVLEGGYRRLPEYQQISKWRRFGDFIVRNFVNRPAGLVVNARKSRLELMRTAQQTARLALANRVAQ